MKTGFRGGGNAYTAIGILLILLCWKLGSLWMDSAIILPAPEAVLRVFLRLVSESDFWRSAGATLLRGLRAFAFSLFAGLLCGIAAGYWKAFRRLLSPILAVIRSTPVLAVILLALIWFQSGQVPVFVTFLMVFPLICGNTIEGMRQIDRDLLEMVRAYRLTRGKKMKHLILPSLLPYLTAASFNGLGLTWKVTVAAEVLSQPRYGVGTGMQYAQLNLETAEVLAWTLVAILLSAITEIALRQSRYLFPWSRVS